MNSEFYSSSGISVNLYANWLMEMSAEDVCWISILNIP